MSRHLERIGKRRVDKFEERRCELAEAALKTLSEIGYARTSLREIAQNSQFTHGVLHYYFKDKIDLIICSVRQYKARCVTRYDGIIETAKTFEVLEHGFLTELASTMRNEAPMHRLWFDLRSQSLFEKAFRADVMEIDDSLKGMIVRVTKRLRELAGAPELIPDDDMYPLYDGVFQRCLLKYLSGDKHAIDDMKASIRSLLHLSVGMASEVKLNRKRSGAVSAKSSGLAKVAA